MNKIVIGNKEIVLEIIKKPIKHTYIRVLNKNHLLVSTNRKTTDSDVVILLEKNKHKIVRMLESVENKPVYTYDEATLFGVIYPIEKVISSRSKVSLEDNCLKIYGKRFDLQIRALERFYQNQVIQAATILLVKLKTIMNQDIDFKGILIKSQRMKSMLGNCNRNKHTIKLNSVLARYDMKYLEAILIHELVHLNVSGHQANFYKLLLKYVPDYRQLKKELVTILKQSEV